MYYGFPVEVVYEKKRPIVLLRERYEKDTKFKELVDKLCSMMISGECSLSDFTGAEAIARERYIDDWTKKRKSKVNST